MATPDFTGGFDCEESKKSKAVEESLQKLVHKAFASAGPSGQKIKNFLNGTWMGHPLHVVLTDVPIGAWTTALVDKFRSRYFDELKANPAAWEPIIEAARHGTVTLIYSSHDTEHNNAVALQEFLQRHL